MSAVGVGKPYVLGGGHAIYYWILYTILLRQSPIYNVTTASTANHYRCSPYQVPVRCRIDYIGILFNAVTSGNVILGVHDMDADHLPNNRICQTTVLGTTSFTANVWEWIIPTTTPTIDPEIYYLGYNSDGTGFTISEFDLVRNANMDTIVPRYRQDIGSNTVPDPMGETVDNQTRLMAMALEVTLV